MQCTTSGSERLSSTTMALKPSFLPHLLTTVSATLCRSFLYRRYEVNYSDAMDAGVSVSGMEPKPSRTVQTTAPSQLLWRTKVGVGHREGALERAIVTKKEKTRVKRKNVQAALRRAENDLASTRATYECLFRNTVEEATAARKRANDEARRLADEVNWRQAFFFSVHCNSWHFNHCTSFSKIV